MSQPVGNLADIGEKLHPLFEDNGIPQGNALSPLFANVYLTDFDHRMIRAGHALVRYADDFVVLCPTEKQARAAYELARSILEDDLGLRMHPLSDEKDAKTRIRQVSRGFSFLGVTFDGMRLFPAKKSRSKLNARLEDAATGSASVRDLLNRVDHVLTGWIDAYAHCDLAPHLDKIDDTVNHHLGKALRRMGWSVTRDNRLPSAARRTSGVPLARVLLADARDHLKRSGTRHRPRRMLPRDDHLGLFSSAWPRSCPPPAPAPSC